VILHRKKNILITGSSGFVGTYLSQILKEKFQVLGLDKVAGIHTSHLLNIEDDGALTTFDTGLDYIVIHCAAARFDYGINAKDYFQENVVNTGIFLRSLEALKVIQFIHIGSVAALDGEGIEYNEDLDCDNAYRSTKYLQQREVIDWCNQNKVPWDVAMPSAIYDDAPRSDTNIGKLQAITHIFPILPKIEVHKSITYLPKFCAFIEQRIGAPSGACFLTIEKPVRTVTQIMRDQADRKLWVIYVPGLKFGLFLLSWLSLGSAALLRREPMLTPSRVTKLFSDTSYATDNVGIDRTTYDGSNL
jgi:nucleoside-diphosphate-sugar epimerase